MTDKQYLNCTKDALQLISKMIRIKFALSCKQVEVDDRTFARL